MRPYLETCELGMSSLFKYMQHQYVEQFIDRGEVRFCSLSYYKDAEDEEVRGDRFEGARRFAPVGGLDITRNGQHIGQMANTSYLPELPNPDQIFVFCVSTILSEELAKRFQADTCIEIIDVNLFTRRLRFQINKLNKRLIADNVIYYDETLGPETVHELPDLMVRAKRKTVFEWQHEYRFVFGSRKTFEFGNVKHNLVIGEGSPKPARTTPYPKPKIIRIGNIRGACKTHHFVSAMASTCSQS
jgi:hypothetical protein